ncbi:nitrogen permease regulator 2 [Plenodomus tracheiphilus IPT5]|uniref:Nitrogen permease regulator 2 n=1 Tax=Plenodomus tracheiphilus IPT5 TaxID=1408161 RepID=A0A6A7AUD5_9PLEO|nr:nitrogen permease regulator 2 [Plenodomus tracheiphilus IPT5]
MPTRAIKAIFYTRFHHEKGNRVLHQVPAGSIIPSQLPSALPTPLIPFPSVTQYLIPTQQFCDRLLTFCVNHHRVIGYPVCIREGRYSRNEFIFNFAIVIGENEADWACYGEVVRKLGRLLRGLEEQGGFLSREEDGVWDDDAGIGTGAGYYGDLDDDNGVGGFGVGGGSKVYALCEMVLEDLNNYAECMIPIDDSNTINLKLFPTRPPPPPILAHQVPLLTMSLSSLQTPISSDLTLNRVLTYINGINSISRIAQLADTDLSLTRRAIQHLVYYGCLVLLDIFSFGAIYAPTAEIGGFIMDTDVKDECMRYVRVPRLRTGSNSKTVRLGSESDSSRDEQGSVSSSATHLISPGAPTPRTSEYPNPNPTPNNPNDDDDGEDTWPIDHETLITLYTSLRQGLTLKNWVLEHLHQLSGIDVRRLITFGIIKGFLYRVHKYAIVAPSVLPPAPPTSLQTSAAPSVANAVDEDAMTVRGGMGAVGTHHGLHPSVQIQRPSIASTTTTLNPVQQQQYLSFGNSKNEVLEGVAGLAGAGAGDREQKNSLMLLKFLDGVHCFDEICSELGWAEKVVEARVRGMGDGVGVVVHR